AMSVAIEPWQKKAKLLNSGVKVFVKRGRNYALSAEQRRKAHKNGEHYLEDTPGRTGKRRRSMYGGMPMGGMTPWPQMPGMMYPMMPQYGMPPQAPVATMPPPVATMPPPGHATGPECNPCHRLGHIKRHCPDLPAPERERLQKRYEEKRKSSSKRHSPSSGYRAGAASKDNKHLCEDPEDYIEMDWARAQSKILVRNQEGQE
ncbi:hypothetical protein ADUPG1_005583, partial [Aduncisulcus paluster]